MATVLVCLFLTSNVAFAISAGTTEPSHLSTLAVMSANERGIPHEMRALAYQKEFNEKLSPLYGGKNSWDKILEGLSEKIGFSVPGSTRFTIEDLWAKFIKANEALVKEGNDRIENDLKTHGKVSEETINRVNELSRRFIFPKELELAIRAHTAELKGWVIARSSGRHEDSYLRNLAGIFISPRKRDERLVVQGVKEILKHAIERIWLIENRNETKTEGVPNLLAPEDGFGILIQPFLQFEASGTAMTNFYGHTSIEAAIGDAEMAVKGIHANVAQFLFNKNNPSRFEYNPSFLTLPYQVRLKGNEYCVDDNPEAMRGAIQNYPQIDGKLSPINEAQARELNRVVSALEDEIGVPLDVEWGFLDGKLYIIQIRPIIGDFKKPLVEVSAELKAKEPIAQTPIALGHTAPGGFNGKMVAIGNNVPRETIQWFEDEFGKDYIRIQSDVASSVLGTKTKAKVLVDPGQGSRQAHNINLITDRIATGEFTYCNGPILKNDLLQHLNFVPHPKLKGVWISDQEVTYFADGLRGSFYESGRKGETFKQNDEYTRQGALIDFHNKVRNAWLKDSVGMPEHAWLLEAMRIFRYGAYFGRTTEEMFVDMLNAQNCNLDFVQRKIMASEYQEDDFEQIQHELNLLEEALSFPLYPSEWESPRLKSIKNLLFLKDMSKKLKEEAQPRPEAVIPQQYTIFLIDPYDSDEGIKEQLEESIESGQITRIGSQELLFRLANTGMKIHLNQMPSLQAANTISAIYLHVNSYYDFSSLFEVLTKIRRENPDALIIIDGNTLSRDQFRQFEQRYGRIILKPNGVFGQDEIIKLINEDHSKWTERKAAQQQQAAAQQKAVVPTQAKRMLTENVQMLVVHDEDDMLEKIKGLLKESFGLHEKSPDCLEGSGYTVFFANETGKAKELIMEHRIEYVIADWVLDKGGECADTVLKYARGFGLKKAGIITGWPAYVDSAREACGELEIDELPCDLGPRFKEEREKLVAYFKSAREEHLNRYNSLLTISRPEKPHKLKVMFVDSDHSQSGYNELRRMLGTEEHELFFAGSYVQALEQMEYNKMDLVVFDIMGLQEQHPSTVSSLGDFFEVAARSRLIVLTDTYGNKAQVITRLRQKYPEGFTHSIPIYPTPVSNEYIAEILKRYRTQQLKEYDRTLTDWDAVHEPKSAKQTPEAQTIAQAKPKKLKILFVNDDQFTLEQCKEAFERAFGLKKEENGHYAGEEYEFIFADSQEEAMQVLDKEHDIDYGIIDWIVGSWKAIPLMNKVNQIGIKVIDIHTAYAEKYVREVKEKYPKLNIAEFPLHPERMIARIKEVRQRQVAEWQTIQPQSLPQAAPVKPERLRILVVEDEPLIYAHMPGVIQQEFPECNVTAANDCIDAATILDKQEFDLIFFDVAMPNIGKVISKLDKTKARLVVHTGLMEDDARRKVGLGLFRRSIFLQKPYITEEHLFPIIKQVRQEQLADYDHALAQWQARQPQSVSKPEKPNKVKVVIVSDDPHHREWFSEVVLVDMDEVETVYFQNVRDAVAYSEKNKVDVLLSDYNIPMANEVDDEGLYGSNNISALLKEVTASNKDALALVFSAGLEWYEEDQFKRDFPEVCLSNYAREGLPAEKSIELIKRARQKQIETYERVLAEWQDRQPQTAPQAIAMTAMPSKPEKLRILIASDEDADEDLLYELEDLMGNSDYEFVMAGNYADAFLKLWSQKFDGVIFDWKMHDVHTTDLEPEVMARLFKDKPLPVDMQSSSFSNLFYRQLANVPNISIRTGASHNEVVEHISRVAGEDVEKRVKYGLMGIKANDINDMLKGWRQKQLQAYEKALAEWHKDQSQVPVPVRPYRLFVYDYHGLHNNFKGLVQGRLPDNINIDCTYRHSFDFDLMEKAGYDVDCVYLHLGNEKNIALVLEEFAKVRQVNPQALLFIETGGPIHREMDSVTEFQRRYGNIIIVDSSNIEHFEDAIKTIAKTCATRIQSQPIPATTVKGETIFVLAHYSAEAKALAKFIQDERGGSCTVTHMEGMWYLERELKTAKPDVVVADTVIDGKNEAENIMRIVRAVNPNAKFIFTSEEAALAEDNPKGENVLAILEKPFHFHDVVSVMAGTYGNRTSAAGVKFQIQESTNIVNSVEKAHAIDKPGIIRVWGGYAAPQFQKSMLTRIRTKTENGPYQVGFDNDMENLVTLACREAKNDSTVTILPSNKLTRSQRKRLESEGAHVIYIDFKDGIELGTDDITQLGAIVFTGIAYLNNNDNALMSLYRLLTGQRHDLVTIEDLKKHPNLLTFILEPAAVHDYNELRQLNELMEREILEAA